jgi:3-hydroxy-9,10-secoandrosta-1,3,5(10)-triene-9,17-dione monooxygenase reductase component
MADGSTAAAPYGSGQRSADQSIGPHPAVRLAGHAPPGPGGAPRPHRPGPALVNGRTDPAEGDGRITPIDGRRFRTIMGRFATGVVAITAVEPRTGRPNGLAANSFTSVSLDPPLVSFCVAHTSTTWPKLREAARFCVNILSAPQLEICRRLANRGGEKFAGLAWTVSPHGGPVIDGTLAWLECSVEAEHVAGDHVIVVARVHHLDRHDDGEPLIFYQGDYGSFRSGGGPAD